MIHFCENLKEERKKEERRSGWLKLALLTLRVITESQNSITFAGLFNI